MAIKDITGLRFGRLVAIKPTEERRDGSVLWLCKCDCGNECLAIGTHLRKNYKKSCGCLQSENGRKNVRKAQLASIKHFGCIHCGSDKHYAKGYCRNCYNKIRRGTLI